MRGELGVKFIPLVWAALRRNRTETALTLLALTVAFTLFGTMVALNTAYEHALAANPLNRLFMFCRFECANGLPYGYREQIARMPDVADVGGTARVGGYHLERSKRAGVEFIDEHFKAAWPELTINEAQLRTLHASRTGVYFTQSAATRWSVRAGDTFTLIADPAARADGSDTWTFTVLGVVDDTADWGQGPSDRIYGSYEYLEQSRAPSKRGRVFSFRISVRNADRARAVCHQIDARYENSSDPTFCVPVRDDAEQLADADISMRQMSLGVAAAGLFMILFLCANGLAESVRERLHEFGTLKALGYGDVKVASIVFLEAAIPALTSALIGTALSWAIGFQITRLAREGALRLPPVPMPFGILASALAAALLIALLSTFVPLQRLRRLDLAAVMARR